MSELDQQKITEEIIDVRSRITRKQSHYSYLSNGGMALGNHPVETQAAQSELHALYDELNYLEKLVGVEQTPKPEWKSYAGFKQKNEVL